jgi:hypothetical protein
MRVQFYGGPLDGKEREWSVLPLRGYTTEPGFPRHTYVFDGDRRFVYSQTLEGTFIIAEVRDKKRRGV